MSIPFTYTVDLNPPNTTIDMRALFPANRAFYGGLDDNIPVAILASDVVSWYARINITEPFPNDIWRSSEEPPRYRFGFWRAYYRGALVESQFITAPIMHAGGYAYYADEPYQNYTSAPGVAPPPPDEPSGFYAFGSQNGADKLIIELAHPNLDGNVQIYALKRSLGVEEFL